MTYKSRIVNIRDFDKNPITAKEAVGLFFEENSDLAIASRETIEEARDIMLSQAGFADDIVARWEDYQEELRCMMAEFM